MRIKQIMQALQEGKTVRLTVRRLRGYVHGKMSLSIPPQLANNQAAVVHMVKCFRFDEKPFDSPVWETL